MALTVGSLQNTVIGDRRLVTFTITPDNSWLAAGMPLTGQQIGLPAGRVDFFFASAEGGYVWKYDYTNKKLLAYYGDNNNAADGPLIAVPDTTDLSAIVPRCCAIGV